MRNIDDKLKHINDRVGVIFNSDKSQIIGYRRKPDINDYIHIANLDEECTEYPFSVFVDCDRYPVTMMFFMRPDEDTDDEYIKQTDIAGYFVASNVDTFSRDDIINSIRAQIDLACDIGHLDDEQRADMHDNARCFIIAGDECARNIQDNPQSLPTGYNPIQQARQTTLTDTPEKRLLFSLF